MTADAQKKVTQGVKQAAPWRKGIPWGIVLAEGIVLVLVGLFLLFAPQTSQRVVGYILAIILAVTGAIQLYGALRARQEGQLGQLNTVRGAVGLAAGALIVILLLLNVVSLQAARVILGLGAVAFGGIGVYLIYLTREAGLRPWPIISNAFWVLFGLLLLLAALGGQLLSSVTQVVNVVLLLGGAFLIIWGIVIKNSKQPTPVN